MSPDVVCFFDNKTNSVSYVVSDPETGHAAVIDPVLDLTPCRAARRPTALKRSRACVGEQSDRRVDHRNPCPCRSPDGLGLLKEKLGGKTGIGAGIAVVRATFGAFNAADVMDVDVTPFDQLFADGATFRIGNIEAKASRPRAIRPPASLCYHTRFVGDTMFMPDLEPRCDFPGGDAKQLFELLQKIISADDMRLFVATITVLVARVISRGKPPSASSAKTISISVAERWNTTMSNASRPRRTRPAVFDHPGRPGEHARPTLPGRGKRYVLHQGSAEHSLTKKKSAVVVKVTNIYHRPDSNLGSI